MSLSDMAEAIGESAGGMVKQFCAEVVTEAVAGKLSRAARARAEIKRLQALIASSKASMALGLNERAMDGLLSEVVSWDEDWNSDKIGDLQLEIVDMLDHLAEGDLEPGEED